MFRGLENPAGLIFGILPCGAISAENGQAKLSAILCGRRK
jgi:hypothetical protein